MQDAITILVVDDDATIRSLLSELLHGEGYDVVTAKSGEEALELVLQTPYPLIISDVKMHAMTGIELLKKIKEVSTDIQVIVMTSYATVDTAVSALRIGAYDFIVKPFEDLQLVAISVRRAVEKLRMVQENKRLIDSLTKTKQDLEQLNEELKRLAIYDGLTGLYNYRQFQEAISFEISRCTRYKQMFSLVIMDIDNFKVYNDANGHPAGDALLKLLAEVLLRRLRKSDMIARYGGEEFICILPATDKSNAFHLAEHLRQLISEHPFPRGETQPLGFVSVSMGIASFPEDGTETSSLIRMADSALFRAKRSGKNTVCLAESGVGL